MSNSNSNSGSRDYKCPCGKAYLSYAAIFTHIKLKHGGKAPGTIQKPNLKSKPRGRPPLTSKKQISEYEKYPQAKKQVEKQKNEHYKYFQAFRQVFNHLKGIQFQEPLEKDLWEDVEIFYKFDSFVESKNQATFQYSGVNLGVGLTQFFKEISSKTQSWRFEQVFIIFMFLLQYIVDENNDSSIVRQAPVQYLVEYMNPFINYYIKDESQRLQINSLWIMEKQNMTKIFMCFYSWLKWKKYTQYCITLIGLQ